jgi:hypothetical protein
LVIQYGDPLAVVGKPPDYPPLSLSVTDLLPLGPSVVDMPFAFVLAGARVSIIGGTGSGKTKVHMRNLINALSACKDVWLAGIDLQGGPEFNLWKRVFQRKAFTPEDANKLLNFLITEMRKRMLLLNINADTDDIDENTTDEWRADLGPYIFLFIDEFPILTEYDGKAGRLDLLHKVITLMRLGRKVGIGVVRAAQASGNQDSGSSLLKKLTSISIVGPCDLADADAIFTPEKRRQGFRPDTLEPADLIGNVNDAGKCYIGCQGFGPYVYRGYAPLSEGEVQRRAVERHQAGLPQLCAPALADIEDAFIVPPALAVLQQAFDHHNAALLPTTVILTHINAQPDADRTWTAKSLAAALREECEGLGTEPPESRNDSSTWSKQRQAKHYFRADVEHALTPPVDEAEPDDDPDDDG